MLGEFDLGQQIQKLELQEAIESLCWPMSALGQKRTLRPVRRMSALPPKADIVQHARDV
jgi:hypothetical protein